MSQACPLSELRIEATTSEHVERVPADLPDRFVDGWRENGHSRVVLAGDDIVATGLSCPNRVHPTRDLLFITVREPWRRQGIGTRLYRELREFHQAPFSAKAAPGSVAHAFVSSLGGSVYQFCPGGRVDATDPQVRAWGALIAGTSRGRTEPGACGAVTSSVPIGCASSSRTCTRWCMPPGARPTSAGSCAATSSPIWVRTI